MLLRAGRAPLLGVWLARTHHDEPLEKSESSTPLLSNRVPILEFINIVKSLFSIFEKAAEVVWLKTFKVSFMRIS